MITIGLNHIGITTNRTICFSDPFADEQVNYEIIGKHNTVFWMQYYDQFDWLRNIYSPPDFDYGYWKNKNLSRTLNSFVQYTNTANDDAFFGSEHDLAVYSMKINQQDSVAFNAFNEGPSVFELTVLGDFPYIDEAVNSDEFNLNLDWFDVEMDSVSYGVDGLTMQALDLKPGVTLYPGYKSAHLFYDSYNEDANVVVDEFGIVADGMAVEINIEAYAAGRTFNVLKTRPGVFRAGKKGLLHIDGGFDASVSSVSAIFGASDGNASSSIPTLSSRHYVDASGATQDLSNFVIINEQSQKDPSQKLLEIGVSIPEDASGFYDLTLQVGDESHSIKRAIYVYGLDIESQSRKIKNGISFSETPKPIVILDELQTSDIVLEGDKMTCQISGTVIDPKGFYASSADQSTNIAYIYVNGDLREEVVLVRESVDEDPWKPFSGVFSMPSTTLEIDAVSTTIAVKTSPNKDGYIGDDSLSIKVNNEFIQWDQGGGSYGVELDLSDISNVVFKELATGKEFEYAGTGNVFANDLKGGLELSSIQLDQASPDVITASFSYYVVDEDWLSEVAFDVVITETDNDSKVFTGSVSLSEINTEKHSVYMANQLSSASTDTIEIESSIVGTGVIELTESGVDDKVFDGTTLDGSPVEAFFIEGAETAGRYSSVTINMSGPTAPGENQIGEFVEGEFVYVETVDGKDRYELTGTARGNLLGGYEETSIVSVANHIEDDEVSLHAYRIAFEGDKLSNIKINWDGGSVDLQNGADGFLSLNGAQAFIHHARNSNGSTGARISSGGTDYDLPETISITADFSYNGFVFDCVLADLHFKDIIWRDLCGQSVSEYTSIGVSAMRSFLEDTHTESLKLSNEVGTMVPTFQFTPSIPVVDGVDKYSIESDGISDATIDLLTEGASAEAARSLELVRAGDRYTFPEGVYAVAYYVEDGEDDLTDEEWLGLMDMGYVAIHNPKFGVKFNDKGEAIDAAGNIVKFDEHHIFNKGKKYNKFFKSIFGRNFDVNNFCVPVSREPHSGKQQAKFTKKVNKAWDDFMAEVQPKIKNGTMTKATAAKKAMDKMWDLADKFGYDPAMAKKYKAKRKWGSSFDDLIQLHGRFMKVDFTKQDPRNSRLRRAGKRAIKFIGSAAKVVVRVVPILSSLWVAWSVQQEGGDEAAALAVALDITREEAEFIIDNKHAVLVETPLSRLFDSTVDVVELVDGKFVVKGEVITMWKWKNGFDKSKGLLKYGPFKVTKITVRSPHDGSVKLHGEWSADGKEDFLKVQTLHDDVPDEVLEAAVRLF